MNMLDKQSIYLINKEVPISLYPRILKNIATEQRRFFLAKRIINWSFLSLSVAILGFCLERLVLQLSKTSIVYFAKVLISDITVAPNIIKDASLAIFESLSSSTVAGMSLSLILILLIISKVSNKNHQNKVIQMKF